MAEARKRHAAPCPHCGTRNPAAAQYCMKCGQATQVPSAQWLPTPAGTTPVGAASGAPLPARASIPQQWQWALGINTAILALAVIVLLSTPVGGYYDPLESLEDQDVYFYDDAMAAVLIIFTGVMLLGAIVLGAFATRSSLTFANLAIRVSFFLVIGALVLFIIGAVSFAARAEDEVQDWWLDVGFYLPLFTSIGSAVLLGVLWGSRALRPQATWMSPPP